MEGLKIGVGMCSEESLAGFLAVEVERACEAFLPTDDDFVAEAFLRREDVGERVKHIADACGLELRLKLLAGELIEILHEADEVDRVSASHVEDLPRSFFSGSLGSAEVGVHRVVHESEVTSLAAITKDYRSLTSEHGGAEFGNDAGVGRIEGLTRAEDIEVAQRNGFEAIELVEELRIALAAILLKRVRRER